MAIERLDIHGYSQTVRECASPDPDMRDGLLLDTPYQRGVVWDTARMQNLVLSLLRGIPVGAITINRRHNPDNPVEYAAVVDGKQRITTIRSFIDGELAVPAEWFSADDRGAYIESTCGPIDYDGTTVEGVRYNGLTRLGRALFNASTIGVAEANVTSVEAEAALFALINFGGLPQSAEDRRRAAAVAAGVA